MRCGEVGSSRVKENNRKPAANVGPNLRPKDTKGHRCWVSSFNPSMFDLKYLDPVFNPYVLTVV